MPQEIRLPRLTEEEALSRIVKWLVGPRKHDPYTIGSTDYGHELYIPHVIDQLFREIIDNDRKKDPGGMRQYYMDPHQEGTSVFYSAAWILCRKNVLYPNPSNPNADGKDTNKGFTVTSYGKRWLSQAKGNVAAAVKLLMSEEAEGDVRTDLNPDEVKSQSSIPTLLKNIDRVDKGADTSLASIELNTDEAFLLNNRYRILNSFPTSGFGQTFLAEDLFLPSKRKCVIKKFIFTSNRPDVYQLMLERFEREAVNLEHLAAACDQIPDLYAHFSENGQFYLVQEWIKGETLANRVKDSGPLGEALVKGILEGILQVLDYVHSHSKIHRDIKPENIVLREEDDKPCLIDFGAVKEIVQTIIDPFGNPSTTIVVGTPGFMPIEQMSGKTLFASDIYALGLTAVYMLTGKRPQELTDPRTGEITWRGSVQEVSTQFASILDKATRIDFRDRFPTAREMLNALSGTNQPTVIEPQDYIITTESADEAALNAKQPIASSDKITSQRTQVDYINRALRAGSIYPIAEELLQHLRELQAATKESGGGGKTDAYLSEELNHLQGEINGLYKLSESDFASHLTLKQAQTLLLKLRETSKPTEAEAPEVNDEEDEDTEYSLVLDAARQVSITKRQRQWRTSDEGVSSARQEVNAMYASLARRVKIANEKLAAADAPLSIGLNRENDDHFILTSDLYSLSIKWDCKSDSTLEDSVLSVHGNKKGDKEEQYYTTEYDIEMNRDLAIGWRGRSQKERFISTDILAKELLEYLVSHIRSQAMHGK